MIIVPWCRVSDDKRNNGAALIIVLAFVVLLSGLVVAYFARTTIDRQLARSSFDNTTADILARSALDIIVGDFRQEIVGGSTGPAGAYVLASNAYIVPMRSGNPPDIPNLIRRSIRNDPISSPPTVPSRASALNSTDDISANGRYISLARWNKHYLIPRLNAGPSTIVDTTPITSFISPDWVLVSNLGPTVLAAPSTSVIGRYAYAVYDEGGLLDMNVAGFPSAASTDPAYLTNIGRKGVLAFADLSAAGLSATANGGIDNMVGWRNYLSALPSGVYRSFSFPANPTDFVNYFLDTTRDFGVVATPSNYSVSNPRTDQALINRNVLLELRRTLTSKQDAMQYLGTFSRELNKPTWSDSGTKLAGRFPLSRFDAFANLPPNAAAAAAIQQNFGLIYVNASGPIAEHWQYVGTTGSTMLTAIPAISGSNQNPDLFSLLQYALPTAGVDEILSIGASLIDQRDANDDTTWIEYGNPSTPQKAFGVDRNPSTDPTAPPQPATVVVLNRSFRNVGELGYAYRNGTTTLDFQTAGSVDKPLLDLFTYNTAVRRSGVVNLNTQNAGVLAAIIKGAFATEAATSGVDLPTATNAANKIITDGINGTAANPAIGREDVARLGEASGAAIGAGEEEKEAIARSLAEVTQTRTWGLLIDVVAQSGRYAPTETNFSRFIVQGEKRYWLHIAFDRFTGEVIDRQLEAVYE